MGRTLLKALRARGLPRGPPRGLLRGSLRGSPRGPPRGLPRGSLRGSPRGPPRAPPCALPRAVRPLLHEGRGTAGQALPVASLQHLGAASGRLDGDAAMPPHPRFLSPRLAMVMPRRLVRPMPGAMTLQACVGHARTAATNPKAATSRSCIQSGERAGRGSVAAGSRAV